MKCVVCYLENNIKLANHLYAELVNKLIEYGIDILRMSDTLMVIDTPHVYTHFVTEPGKLINRRLDRVFKSETIDEVLNYILNVETTSKF